MDSFEEIDIPEILPVMTLRGTVLFPHAVMPLFIFEERYRQMLDEVLETDRLFAIFNEGEEDDGIEEPPASMGTVGIVRAAQKNPDGTTNLALQGLMRVQLIEIVQEFPYRLVRIKPCPSAAGEEETDESHAEVREHILSVIEAEPELRPGLPPEYIDFLRSLTQPAPFIDVTIHSVCQSAEVKQRLLETLSLSARYRVFDDFLSREQEKLQLFQRLQGETREDEIDLN